MQKRWTLPKSIFTVSLESSLVKVTLVATALVVAGFAIDARAEAPVVIPAPKLMESPATTQNLEKAVFAGGCFWGVQGVFQHVKGVHNVLSGYAGGQAKTASYETVSDGQTGHAESVEITFDPHVINYATLLQIYFSVAHNPTELNFQGPDSGTQYRSAIFPNNDAQAEVAKAYIKQLDAAHVFTKPIVTTIEPSKTFYKAEDYHQDYATLHPDSPYIAINDLPKIANLSKVFPSLYRPKPKLVNG
jgi:peptide-methionine (S)-S-oxide reductase